MRFVLLALAATGLTACQDVAMPDASDGRSVYMENCAACHGENARGDGPLARTMAKAPKDLTLIALRNDNRFPRAKVMSTVDGYARAEIDLPGMPTFGDMLQGDLIPFDSGDGVLTPTPRKLVALVDYLEQIQQTR